MCVNILVKIPSLIPIDLLDVRQKEKRARIEAIANSLEKEVIVSYTKFLAQMQHDGLRPKIAKEYLQVLQDLDLILIIDDEIGWISALPIDNEGNKFLPGQKVTDDK